MKTQKILDRLIYLDPEYMSGQYELRKGISPETRITKTEALNASVKIPLFSGGASSTESKAYALSTLGMLVELHDEMKSLSDIDLPSLKMGGVSSVGWVSGILSIYKTTISERGRQLYQKGKLLSEKGVFTSYSDRVISEETYFGVQIGESAKFALVTSPEYFSSGMDTFLRLRDVVIDEIGIPVRALVRVYSAQSQFKQWVAVPFIILESGG